MVAIEEGRRFLMLNDDSVYWCDFSGDSITPTKIWSTGTRNARIANGHGKGRNPSIYAVHVVANISNCIQTFWNFFVPKPNNIAVQNFCLGYIVAIERFSTPQSCEPTPRNCMLLAEGPMVVGLVITKHKKKSLTGLAPINKTAPAKSALGAKLWTDVAKKSRLQTTLQVSFDLFPPIMSASRPTTLPPKIESFPFFGR